MIARRCRSWFWHPRGDDVEPRERHRAKTGYRSFTPEQLGRVLRTETPAIGYWLDSTALTVKDTVEEVLANLDDAALIP